MKNLLIGFILILAGTGIVYFGYVDYQNTQNLLSDTVEVEGEVEDISIEEDTDSGTETMYRSVVEYKYEYEGQEYKASATTSYQSSVSSAEGKVDEFEEGETTPVYVDPDEPRKSYIKEDFPFTIFLFLGGFSIVVGVFFAAKQFFR